MNGDHLWNSEVSLAALTSLLFIEIQWNGLLRAKGLWYIIIVSNMAHEPRVTYVYV